MPELDPPKRVDGPCLGVVMPVFNEAGTVAQVIQHVLAQPMVQQLVVVNDASTDGTREVLGSLARADGRVSVIHHERNRGKGAALRTGLAAITAPFVIVQDADLEYDPSEYDMLLRPLLDDHADVVSGSRFLGAGEHRVLYFWHAAGNRLLTLVSNMVTNLNLSDMETCYKVFRREVIQKIQIRENRFGFEPEITAKVARLNVRIYEVPISYYGRTYAEGKKIGWRDGFRAFWCLLKYRLVD
jgi:glycosyltransferase involved in cell wall biosynthesis